MAAHSQPDLSLKLCAQASQPSPGTPALAFFEEATSSFPCVASPSQHLQLTLLRALSLGNVMDSYTPHPPCYLVAVV